MGHTCHAIGCSIPVPPEMFMCRKHWFSLPKRMRDVIWQFYRTGQCDDQNPSKPYCQQAVDCIRFVAHMEGKLVAGNELELIMYLQFHSPLNGVNSEH